MLKEMYVKKGYSYVNARGQVFGQGTIVQVDMANEFVEKQAWKLESREVVVEPEPIPEIVLGDGPMPTPPADENLMKDVNNIVDKLGYLTEPPKVKVDPKAKKPGTGIDKEKAETMLDRVKNFVEEQKEEAKK